MCWCWLPNDTDNQATRCALLGGYYIWYVKFEVYVKHSSTDDRGLELQKNNPN